MLKELYNTLKIGSKASNRDIIVVDDKELVARNSECYVFNLSNCSVVFKM